MFGHHARKREQKRLFKAQDALKREKKDFEKKKPEIEMARDKENAVNLNNSITEKTNQAKNERHAARKEGKEYATEVINRDIQGLTPAKRSAMQYEADRNIQRNMESANRRLLGDQGQRGIVGKGGVGYAQQRDLQRIGQEEQGKVRRDLDVLDSDMALKKLAAMFNIEQGEASQSQLDKQLAKDELQLNDERKRQRNMEDQINSLFSRI